MRKTFYPPYEFVRFIADYVYSSFFFWQINLVFFPEQQIEGCWRILKSYFYFVRVLFGNCEFTMGLTYWGQKPGVSQAEYPERLLLMPAVGTLGDILQVCTVLYLLSQFPSFYLQFPHFQVPEWKVSVQLLSAHRFDCCAFCCMCHMSLDCSWQSWVPFLVMERCQC